MLNAFKGLFQQKKLQPKPSGNLRQASDHQLLLWAPFDKSYRRKPNHLNGKLSQNSFILEARRDSKILKTTESIEIILFLTDNTLKSVFMMPLRQSLLDIYI